jgi:hypothetical protein
MLAWLSGGFLGRRGCVGIGGLRVEVERRRGRRVVGWVLAELEARVRWIDGLLLLVLVRGVYYHLDLGPCFYKSLVSS